MAKTRNMTREDAPFQQSMCAEHNYDHAIFVSEYPWWYLSFADPTRPKGQRFLGCALVQGRDIGQATQRAWRLGINPGGEVAGAALIPEVEPQPEWRDRLLTQTEAEAMPEPQRRQP